MYAYESSAMTSCSHVGCFFFFFFFNLPDILYAVAAGGEDDLFVVLAKKIRQPSSQTPNSPICDQKTVPEDYPGNGQPFACLKNSSVSLEFEEVFDQPPVPILSEVRRNKNNSSLAVCRPNYR